MKLWSGRMSGETDELFSAINDSLAVDARLVQEDIDGSIAWAKALGAAKILTSEQVDSIEKSLHEIADEAVEMTAFEDFVTGEVRKGRSILGLYPATDPQTLVDFAEWRKKNGR